MFTIRTDPEPFLTYYRLIDLLTQRRKALKMTQEELGKHCQISMGAISNIEKGRKQRNSSPLSRWRMSSATKS